MSRVTCLRSRAPIVAAELDARREQQARELAAREAALQKKYADLRALITRTRALREGPQPPRAA